MSFMTIVQDAKLYYAFFHLTYSFYIYYLYLKFSAQVWKEIKLSLLKKIKYLWLNS